MDKNSQEYKLVMSLYDSGKITAADRDRLLDALDDGPVEPDASDDSIKVEVESKVGDADEETEIDVGAGKPVEYRVTIVYAAEGELNEQKIKDVCADIEGVENVRVDADKKTFTVGGNFDNTTLMTALESAGCNVTPTEITVRERGKRIHVDMNGEGTRVDIDDKPAFEYIKSAFVKVSSVIGNGVEKGVKFVGAAGEKIVRAAGDIVHTVGDFITDLAGNDEDDN